MTDEKIIEQSESKPIDESKMNLYADTVAVVYDNYLGREVKVPPGYELEYIDNLKGALVNKDQKETVLAFRGLLPADDLRDIKITYDLAKRGVRSFFMDESPALRGAKGELDYFQDSFSYDQEQGQRLYEEYKAKYPNHKIVFSGHSRGGKSALELGRFNNEETHSFAGYQQPYEFDIQTSNYDPKKIHQYYTGSDLVPYFSKYQNKRNSNENHYYVPVKPEISKTEIFGTKGHNIKHYQGDKDSPEFIEDRVFRPQNKFTRQQFLTTTDTINIQTQYDIIRFSRYMRKINPNISDSEIKIIFDSQDTDKDGIIFLEV